MLNLKVILGSTRPNRISEKLLSWLNAELAKQKDLSVEVLDLRDHALPFYDQPASPSGVKNGEYPTDAARAWAAKIQEGDAFIMIAPEYNHGYTAVLKNALDTVYAEWNNKPVGFVSYGSVAGARSVEQLRQVAIELQMAPVRQGVHIQSFWTIMDDKGAFKPAELEQYAQPLQTMTGQLLMWGEALKGAREKAVK